MESKVPNVYAEVQLLYADHERTKRRASGNWWFLCILAIAGAVIGLQQIRIQSSLAEHETQLHAVRTLILYAMEANLEKVSTMDRGEHARKPEPLMVNRGSIRFSTDPEPVTKKRWPEVYVDPEFRAANLRH